VESTFSLFTAFPRQKLQPSDEALGECAVIVVENHSDDPDLELLFAATSLPASASSEVRD
jgi:hypothetical protein